MNIEVHFGGHFISTQGGQKYVGGKCEEIRDFDTDLLSWFELRYMLKKLGIISNYKVLCLGPNESLDSGLESVFSDQCILRILQYLGVEQNIVLYIDHLVEGSEHEMLPDYCLRQKDDPKDIVPSVNNQLCVAKPPRKQSPIKSPLKKTIVCRHPRVKIPEKIHQVQLERFRAVKNKSTTPSSLQPNTSATSVAVGNSSPAVGVGKSPSSVAVGKRDSTVAPSGVGQRPPSDAIGQRPPSEAIGQSPPSEIVGKSPPSVAVGKRGSTVAVGKRGSTVGKRGSTVGKRGSTVAVGKRDSTVAPSGVGQRPPSEAVGQSPPSVAVGKRGSTVAVGTPPSTPPSKANPPSEARRRSPRFISATPPPSVAPSEYISATLPPTASTTPPPSVAPSEYISATPPPTASTASPGSVAPSEYISATTPPSRSTASPGLRRSPRFMNKVPNTLSDNDEWSPQTWSKYMQQVEDEFAERMDPPSNPPNLDIDMDNESVSDEDYVPEEDSLPEAGSEYSDSGSLHSQTSSDEEFTSKPKYPEFKVKSNNIDMEVGMQFESPEAFRMAIRDHAIKNGFDLFWQKNEGARINVKCRAAECPFRVYCSWNTEKTRYCIKTLQSKHTCNRPLSNQQVTKRWLAKEYLDHFRSDPNMKWNVLQDMVQRDVGISITQNRCYRVRKLALEELQGKDHEQYDKLWDYAHVLLKSNPGSYIKLKTKAIADDVQNVRFEAIFVSFAAMLTGLLSGCRPVIGMDGCHLTSANGGIMLSAISRDPNNQMYPVAYAVVEVENKETWTWFISNLLEALGIQNVEGWTFICDRQKGLVESLKLLVPRAEVRFCVRHLYANFKEKYKGLILKKFLWEAAGSYTKEGHAAAMKEIKNLRLEAFEYLDAIDKQLWARSYFSTNSKCDLLTNNICESWNKFILPARDKPILCVLELIRRLLMRRYEMKRQVSESITTFGGRIREKLQHMANGARKCTPYKAAPTIFEVVEKDNQVVVSLDDNTCTCKQWQMTGIPCRHVMCCIQYLRMKPEEFVHEYYRKERYIAAYRGIIYPIADKSTWEKQAYLKILPPTMRKQPGRPKKCRKRAKDEAPKTSQHMSRKGQIMRCSKCKQLGHNKTRCKSTEGGNVRNESSRPNLVTGRKRSRSKKDQPTSSATACLSSQQSTLSSAQL